MQHAGQAEPEQADRIFSGQKSAQAVTQGQTGLSGCFPADISVKELPGFQPLLPAVIPEAIDVGLPGRILPDVCSVFPVELMNGRSFVRTVPVERLVYAGQSVVQMCIDGNPPVIQDVSVPFLEDFPDKIFADQHAVSRCTVIKQQILQLTGRVCNLHVPVGAVDCTGVVGGNAQIVVADGFHLCGDFFFIPDIILVGNGDIISFRLG